jgi:hypothetical protein
LRLAQSTVPQWPSTDIDRTVRPTEAQRASLVAVQDAAAKAADMSKGSCPADNLLTPTARLATVRKRLDTLLAAIHFSAFHAVLRKNPSCLRPPSKRIPHSGNSPSRRSWDRWPQALAAPGSLFIPKLHGIVAD